MITAIKDIHIDTESRKFVEELYILYAAKLMAYTRKNYQVPEDDAMNLVYKTIYRIAEVRDRYHFSEEARRQGFVFRTFLNYLKNYYRDNKSFETKNFEVDLADLSSEKNEQDTATSPQLILLQQLLDRMEDWERILLLMRGQDIPYSEISVFVNKPEKQLKVYYARLKKKLLEDMNERLNEKDFGK